MKYALALICGLLLATLARAENPRCVAEFEAESTRIQREAMARAPAPGSDQNKQRLPQGTPSVEQQRAYREAETRILDARMDCLRRAR